MLQVIQDKSVSLLQNIVSTLEKYDDIDKRPNFFS